MSQENTRLSQSVEYSIFMDRQHKAHLAAAAALSQRNDAEEKALRNELGGLAASADKAVHEASTAIDAVGLAGGHCSLETDKDARKMAEVACNKLAFVTPRSEEAALISAFETAAYGDDASPNPPAILATTLAASPELFLCAFLGDSLPNS